MPKGELVGILNVCAGNKKPAPMIRGGHAQIVMVAGARNHLYFLRFARAILKLA